MHQALSKLSSPRSWWMLAAVVGACLMTTSAQAQERKERGVITLAVVNITGRIQKPIAAIDVARIQPKLTLAELRQPFLDRIEKAIYKEPF